MQTASAKVATSNNQVSNINILGLVSLLSNVKGCQFVNLEMLTEVKMNKKNNPFYGRVTKLSQSIRQFNYSYEKAVNNRGEKEQGEAINFVSSELIKGQKWLHVNKIITNEMGQLYVRFYTVNGAKENTIYFLDNIEMTPQQIEDIKQFIPKKKDSVKQTAHGLTDNQVKPFAPKIENILSITLQGTKYIIQK